MPVSTAHSDYSDQLTAWTRCRDFFSGSDAVKEKETDYLPQPAAMDSNEYDAYVTRALFYGATARTVNGLNGSVFRRPPEVEAPDAVLQELEDVTLDGVPFEAFAKSVFQDLLIVGRYGVLLEMPSEPSLQVRPYWVGYPAEKIINWRTRRVRGTTVTSLVVLEETKEVVSDDLFVVSSQTRYRVLLLDEEDRYVVQIWETADNNNIYSITEEYFPMVRGQRLDFIPFQFFNATTITPQVEKPPLLDLVDVNLSHYQTSADLEHARHYTALATLFLAGFDPESTVKFGSSNALVSKDANAKAEVIAGKAENCSALENALSQKEAMMAAIGARMIEPQKRGVEAAETLRMRQSGDQSVLQSMAATASQGLTNLVSWHSSWIGAGEAATVTLNTDFFDETVDPQTAEVIMAMWQGQIISKKTAFFLLQRGELTRPGITYEEEEAEILMEVPPVMPTPDLQNEDEEEEEEE